MDTQISHTPTVGPTFETYMLAMKEDWWGYYRRPEPGEMTKLFEKMRVQQADDSAPPPRTVLPFF